MKYLESIKTAISQDDSADEGEKLFLYGLVRAIKPKIIVETGTHRGLSALYMAQALHENGAGHIYTADPYDFQQEQNFIKFPVLKEYITYQRCKGEDVQFVGQIDLLFIDSYHEKEVVEAEMKALFPRLAKHAIVIFHDAEYYEEHEAHRRKFNGVNDAVAHLKTVWIPTKYRLRIYEHSGT